MNTNTTEKMAPSDERSGKLARILRRLWMTALHRIHPFVCKTGSGACYTLSFRKKMYARYLAGAVCFAVLYVALFTHIFRLQLFQQREFNKNALEKVLSMGEQSAPRGRIFDDRGLALFACDLATRDIFVEPRHFAKGRMMEILDVVCPMLNLERTEVLKKWNAALAYERGVRVVEGILEEDQRLEAVRALPGVDIQPDENGVGGSYTVFYYPLRAERKGGSTRKVTAALGKTFGVSIGKLREESERAYNRVRQVVLKRDVPRDVADHLLHALQSRKMHRGFVFRDAWVRSYPQKNVCANLVGFLNSDHRGISGIEALMDRVLRPTPGHYLFKHDKQWRPLDEGMTWKQRPSAGADVYLSINSRLQQIAEEELGQLWEKFKPQRAYAIMADPSTGAILALAQYPQFDPNDTSTMKADGVTPNHCLVQAYEPGSIMKGISLTGVLDKRIATLNTKVDCENGHWLYNRSLLKDSHRIGVVTLAEVVEQSSNIGTAKFSLQMGEERMYQYLCGYGFGKPTGLGFYPDVGYPQIFKHEARGRFKDLHVWDSLTITRMPMGQGLSLTPMQIIQAWMALANGGVMMQPYIVDKVRFPQGGLRVNVPRVKAVTASPEAVSQMVKALTLVTEGEHATGKRAAIPGYHVAGKTGTAQFWVPADKEKDIKGHYSQTEYLASFVGFVPAERPAFVLLVSAERPSVGYHTGSGVSAPVFRKIAERSLDYLQVRPTVPVPSKIAEVAKK